MGAAAGPAAGGTSLMAIGLTAAGSIAKGQGIQAADEMQAAQAQQAAEFGRTQATLTDATMRERLNTTLANIDAVRAAGHVDPTSPTTASIEDWQKEISRRQQLTSDVSLRSQAATEEASAVYLKSAGEFALTQGYLGAAADIAGGLSKGLGKGGAFNPSSG